MTRLQQLLERIIPYTTALFIALILQRCIEFFRSPDELLGESVQFVFLLKGLFFDLFTSLLLTAFSLIIQVLVSFVFKTRTLLFFHILNILFLVLNFVLIEIFLITNEPLSESVFNLSWKEIQIIAGSGDRISIGLMFVLLFAVLLYFFFGKLLSAKKVPSKMKMAFGLSLPAALFFIPVSTYTSDDSHTETIFVNNRLTEFSTASVRFFFNGTSKKDVTVQLFKDLDPEFSGGKKLNEEYPLFHSLPDNSEFSKFFQKKKTPPNIVIIIVESLSTSLVGEKADKTGHIMPFLDSISTKSMYFPNFLSTCERTHNVLPASLSSLPNAPEGEMFMKMEHADHWSLISLLKKNYYSRFYCGVDLSYSNMNGFMNFQKTDYLVKNWDKPPYKMLSNRENSWGYTDGQLFEKSWKDYKNQSLNKKKRLDVFLTISTHEPFVIPNQGYYAGKVKAKIDRIKHPSKTQVEVREKADKFAVYSYLDDELRAYFKKAKQQPDFDNTLFFIFGDHGSELCSYDEMEKYKIPLIIYSSLVKKPEVIRSVSTHLDLAPTLINYLRLTYGLPLPEKVPFIGKELSLEKKFECKRSLPFNSVNMKNDDLLHGNYFFSHNRLFQVNKELTLTKVKDAGIEKQELQQLEYYNNLSSYVFYRNKFVPPSIYGAYVETDQFTRFFQFNQEELSKKECCAEYINLGKDLVLPDKTKDFKIKVSCDVLLHSKTELTKIPFLTVAVSNKINGKDSLLLWKQMNPYLVGTFHPEEWSKLEYTMTIRSKDLGKVLSKNHLAYYLLNYGKKEFKIKNVKTVIFIQPIRKKAK